MLTAQPLSAGVVRSAAQQLSDSHALRTLTRRAYLLLLSCICRRYHAAPTAETVARLGDAAAEAALELHEAAMEGDDRMQVQVELEKVVLLQQDPRSARAASGEHDVAEGQLLSPQAYAFGDLPPMEADAGAARCRFGCRDGRGGTGTDGSLLGQR